MYAEMFQADTLTTPTEHLGGTVWQVLLCSKATTPQHGRAKAVAAPERSRKYTHPSLSLLGTRLLGAIKQTQSRSQNNYLRRPCECRLWLFFELLCALRDFLCFFWCDLRLGDRDGDDEEDEDDEVDERCVRSICRTFSLSSCTSLW